MRNIILIGAGRLGSRHWQALGLLDEPIRLTVLDPSAQALKRAEENFHASLPGRVLDYACVARYEDLPPKADLAIVATTADARAIATRQLLDRCDVPFIVFEKVLFQSARECQDIQSLLQNKGIHAWVNCPRRMFPVYQALQTALAGERDIFCCVSGGAWGMACNSIHMVDLLFYLTGAKNYKVDTSGLDSIVHPAKREGFIELTGVLSLRFDNGSRLVLQSRTNSTDLHNIRVESSKISWTLREAEGRLFIQRAAEGWRTEESKIEIPPQSRLSHLFVQSILNGGHCGLPDFSTSVQEHIPLLNALLDFYNNQTGQNADQCPIT